MPITIKPPKVAEIELGIVGTSRLVTHAWSQKAIETMEAKQQQKAHGKKGPKIPEDEYQEARYLDAEGRDSFPTTGFKKALISATRFVDGLKMTEVRGALFIPGDYITIHYEGDKPEMRTDTVRLQGSTTDLRYRPSYEKWWAMLPIEYNADFISAEQIANLVNLAGFSIGIGEYRPEKSGEWGRFRVAEETDQHLFEAAA